MAKHFDLWVPSARTCVMLTGEPSRIDRFTAGAHAVLKKFVEYILLLITGLSGRNATSHHDGDSRMQ